MGFKQTKQVIQLDAMDYELKTCLWNVLVRYFWSRLRSSGFGLRSGTPMETYYLINNIWLHYFKEPIDELGDSSTKIMKEIKDYFFNCEWYEVYDFIEFIADTYSDDSVVEEYAKSCNVCLEQEMSGYRFAGTKITPITNEEELGEIDQALQSKISPARQHIKKALDYLSDRKSPDYRNSIKEAISAVEAVCKVIANNESADLNKALSQFQGNEAFHGAFSEAIKKMYAYTSDEDGIRHSLFDEPNIGFEDAKFMLVACSAFVNYLVAKAEKAGLIKSST